jgi:hypothetical protein
MVNVNSMPRPHVGFVTTNMLSRETSGGMRYQAVIGVNPFSAGASKAIPQ